MEKTTLGKFIQNQTEASRSFSKEMAEKLFVTESSSQQMGTRSFLS